MTIRCEQFKTLWHEQSAAAPDERLYAHLNTCPGCRAYARQMQSLLSGLKNLTTPEQAIPAPERINRLFAHARRQYRADISAGGIRSRYAVAATLFMGFVSGALFWAVIGHLDSTPRQQIVSRHAHAIELPLAEVRKVSLAVDSDRAVPVVTFTLDLPAGIELEGYPGQTRLSWQGQLQAGLNRLTLPLIARKHGHGGILKARIEYAGQLQELRLPLYAGGQAYTTLLSKEAS